MILYFFRLEIATVITAYTATSPDQLSLVPGQYIAVKAKNANGWWEGQLQVDIAHGGLVICMWKKLSIT